MKKILLKTITVFLVIAAALFPFFVFHDAKTYLSHEVYRRGLFEDGELYLDLRMSSQWAQHWRNREYCIENAYSVSRIEGVSLSAEKKVLSGEEFSLDITLHNDTDDMYISRHPVILEKKIGGKWYVLNGYDAAFFSPAVIFEKNSETNLSVDLCFTSNDLYKGYKVDGGRYRVIVEACSAKDTWYIAEEFYVKK